MTTFEDYHGVTGQYVECADCGSDVYVPPWEDLNAVLAAHAEECEG